MAMSQADLFSQPPYQRHSETSKAAADSVKESAGTLREQVYDCIEQWGPICDEVISAMTKIPPNTVRPRRVELLRAGRIKAWGKTRTRSGRSAVAWGVIQ